MRTGRDTVYYDSSDEVSQDCELQVLVHDEGFLYEGTNGADRIIADRGPAPVRGDFGNDRVGATPNAVGVRLFGGGGNDRVAGNSNDDALAAARATT